MKTFKLIVSLMMAGVMGLLLSSCSKVEKPAPAEPEYITVDLGLSGEYVEISESPLATRASADTSDLIGIAVYSVTKDPYMEGSYTRTNYAYGIFNSLENVKIKLLAGQTYQFVASIVVDGHFCGIHQYGGCDSNMFSSWNVSKDFNYTSQFDESYFRYLHESYGSPNYKFHHDRFYGELAEYNAEKDGTVLIQTKRVAYGVHYIAEGLVDGYLNIEVRQPNSSNYLYYVDIPAMEPEKNGIYSFQDLCSAWRGVYNMEKGVYEDYYANKTLNITWIKNDGSRTPMGSYDVIFKRNIRTKVRIRVEDSSTPNGIVVTRQDEVMYDDDTEYLISGGKVVEVPVSQE